MSLFHITPHTVKNFIHTATSYAKIDSSYTDQFIEKNGLVFAAQINSFDDFIDLVKGNLHAAKKILECYPNFIITNTHMTLKNLVHLIRKDCGHELINAVAKNVQNSKSKMICDLFKTPDDLFYLEKKLDGSGRSSIIKNIVNLHPGHFLGLFYYALVPNRKALINYVKNLRHANTFSSNVLEALIEKQDSTINIRNIFSNSAIFNEFAKYAYRNADTLIDKFPDYFSNLYNHSIYDFIALAKSNSLIATKLFLIQPEIIGELLLKEEPSQIAHIKLQQESQSLYTLVNAKWSNIFKNKDAEHFSNLYNEAA